SQRSGYHHDLPSFPTRRSSDLIAQRSSRSISLKVNSRGIHGVSTSTSATPCSRKSGSARSPLALFSHWRSRNSMAKRKSRGNRRSEEHTSELQSQSNLVCRLLL